MLRNLAWQGIDELTRAQLAMFQGLGDEIRMGANDRRCALGLDERTWLAWLNFSADGPLPAEPKLPEMLRRLGEAAFKLAVVAAEPKGGVD